MKFVEEKDPLDAEPLVTVVGPHGPQGHPPGLGAVASEMLEGDGGVDEPLGQVSAGIAFAAQGMPGLLQHLMRLEEIPGFHQDAIVPQGPGKVVVLLRHSPLQPWDRNV